MDTDLILFGGLIFGVLSLTAALSAFSDGRRPWSGGILAAIAVAMLLTAQFGHPDGYAFRDVPDVVIGVIARVFN